MADLNIKDKITQYLHFKGISDYRLEKSLEVSKGYWNKAKNPSSDILCKICSIYTDLSAEWLLRGDGSMIKTNNISIEKDLEHLNDLEQDKITERINSMPGDYDLIHFYEQAIGEKDKEILKLQAENFMLKRKVLRISKTPIE